MVTLLVYLTERSTDFILVEKIGRRRLMLGSLFFMIIGSGLLAISFNVLSEANVGLLAIPSIVLVVGAFEAGAGPLFFILATESFSDKCKEQAQTFTNIMAWIFNITVSYGFPVVNDALGPESGRVFYIFFGTAAIVFVLSYYHLKETKKNALNTTLNNEDLSTIDGQQSNIV